MDDRVHRAYDGELDPDDLTPDERLELASMSELLSDVAHALRSVPAPDLTARVMAALPVRSMADSPGVTSRLHSALTWLWRPRQFAISWRPAYLALVVVLLATGWVSVREITGRGPFMGAEAATPPLLYVQFRLEAPGAVSVELAGSFTNWNAAVPLIETMPGIWSTSIALEPGVYDYAFVVDGRTWVVDPSAPKVEDGFGGMNSRLFLPRPDGNV